MTNTQKLPSEGVACIECIETVPDSVYDRWHFIWEGDTPCYCEDIKRCESILQQAIIVERKLIRGYLLAGISAMKDGPDWQAGIKLMVLEVCGDEDQ